ncbi:hypothetical protein Plhal304r1_c001g0001011 [Plasmopara halstedii]
MTNLIDRVVLRRIREMQIFFLNDGDSPTTISSWLVSNYSSMIVWHFIVFYINKIHVRKLCKLMQCLTSQFNHMTEKSAIYSGNLLFYQL